MSENDQAQQSQTADFILRNGTVLTMNANRQILSPGSVAILGNEIAAIDTVQAIDQDWRAENVIDCTDRVIMPGLVNTHTHMPMSLLRGLADDMRLDVWLHGYMLPVEQAFVNPEFCFLGTTLSCAEMLRGGTTCFADMYYHEEEVAWAAVQAGMRGVCGETIMKFPTPDAASYEESLAYCQEFVEHWRGHELIVACPAPHSPYMCTADILRETTRLALENDVPQLIHVSETADEVETWIEATTMRPVRWLEEHGVLDSKVVAAHCVHVNSEEMVILGDHGVGVAHNPTSNLKLASGIAPIAEMLEKRLNVGIGTDGCASNNDLDMFEELRLACLLAKAVTANPVAVPAYEAVAMATIYGARALHLDHLIGSIEPGKRADLIVVEMDQLWTTPRFETTGANVYSRIAYAAKACDVRDVFVNGKQLVRDHQCITINEADVISQAKLSAQRITRFFVAREKSVYDKLVAIGGVEQRETFEVQAKGHVHDRAIFEKGLQHPDVRVTGQTVRDQYDTYFRFDDDGGMRLRYREDNVIGTDGIVSPIYTLTLTGPTKEAEYENSVVLSRSRYTAPANRSLRFYGEYFQHTGETEIIKHRERYHVRYEGVDFAVNLDRLLHPKRSELYAEIKSRTWSHQDAVHKAELIVELFAILGSQPEDLLAGEYVDLFDIS